MKDIHLIMPFSRPENIERLINAYEGKGVYMHPILFEDEAEKCKPLWSKLWIRPFVIRESSKLCTVLMPGTYKRNRWIAENKVIDDDYYLTADDDDSYDPDVFEAIRKMDDDVVIISMKRGTKTPDGADIVRSYPTSTLIAKPENMEQGKVSAQQMFVKGRLFKEHPHNEESHSWDGELAEHYKAEHEVAYRPDLFALFNYFEPGRWTNDLKLAFGVMTNLPSRLGMALQQSEISGDMHFIRDPESATKGLNQLLDRIAQDDADVAVLTHHDMSFRKPWLSQVRQKLAELPSNWTVAGIIGKDMEGRVCGRMSDSRIPIIFDTINVHEFPVKACCFDECLIFVNMKSGFRFDETLDGFDLYGTLCVLQTWEMGGSAWIIDSGAVNGWLETEHGKMNVDVALATHHCTRPFSWFPDEQFQRNYKWLFDRFKNAERLDTTVIAVPEEKRFETSAA